jgi:radical SAM superfamily enzyme YgiQ (UPF0313 family)
MRLALINPKGTYISSQREIQKLIAQSPMIFQRLPQFRIIPHLGLLTLGALATKDFETIEYIDENVVHDPAYLNKSYDLVCVSAMTHQAFRAYEIGKHFRARGIPVILGGVHASLMPEEAQEFANAVVIGEVEGIWGEVMADFQAGTLKKLYRSCQMPDLSLSSVPRYELVDASQFDVYPVQTTRGCPHRCEFCVVHKIYGNQYRKKPVTHVLQCLDRIKEISRKKSPVVFFTDDNMLADKKFSEQLLKALVPYRIKWSTQSDISIGYDDEFLKLIRKSGGFQILIGFESLNSQNLSQIEQWKAHHLENYEKLVQKIQSYGICIIGTFIVGLDEDTPDVFPKILEFVCKTGLFDAQILIATPLPGTELMARMQQEGRLLKEIFWDRCNLAEINFKPRQMSVETLAQGYLWLYKNLYTQEDMAKKMDLLKKSLLVYRELMEEEK